MHRKADQPTIRLIKEYRTQLYYKKDYNLVVNDQNAYRKKAGRILKNNSKIKNIYKKKEQLQ